MHLKKDHITPARIKPVGHHPVFLIAAGILFFSGLAAADGPRGIHAGGMEKQIDRIVMPLVEENLLSGVILVAVDDAVVAQKAYGMASIEDGVANREDTKFAIASVTKMFTAVAVMQLVELGKLDLLDKLSRHLPGFPRGEKITIRHLLAHTSGLPSFNTGENRFIDMQGVIGLIKDLPLKFEPGEGFAYSNSGYALLAFLIEKISGLAYEEYLRQHIFAPAGMNQSGMIPQDPAKSVDGLARGYSLTESGRLQPSDRLGPEGKGAGSLFSTAGDMLRFSRALFGGKLISRPSREAMMTPGKEAHGLGCIVEDYRDWKVAHHPGGTQGVRTSFKTFFKPGHSVVVIDLFNTDFMLSHLVDRQIEKIALGEPGEPIFSVIPSRIDSFRALAGTYEFSADETFQITVEGDQVYYQEPGQKKRRAFPFSGTALFIKDINSRFHFTANRTSGDVTFTGFYGTPAGALMVEGKRIRGADRKDPTVGAAGRSQVLLRRSAGSRV